MTEATKSDIHDLHKRIDEVVKSQNQTNIVLERIDTTLKFQPKLPARPCDFHTELQKDFDGHVADHKDIKRIWQRPIIGTVVDLAKMAFVAFVTWLFLRKE